jgi:hypothetical protein
MKTEHGLTLFQVYLNHTQDDQKITVHRTDGSRIAFRAWYYDNALDFFNNNKGRRCSIAELEDGLHIFMK